MTIITPLLLVVTALPAGYLACLFLSPRRASTTTTDRLPSALIPSYTSHARLLPVPSRHTFSYPLIYLGADIDALETGAVDLPGQLFTYGGSPWSKILGLRSFNYLTPGSATLRQKLNSLLIEHGLSQKDMVKAWMVSMPSLLGFEGINPLTVWYVYNQDRVLSCIVLEVHNTFGEKHAYVLKSKSEHAVNPNEGYDFAWIFPRTFHVSPFNSRNGFYRLDILNPFPTSAASAPPRGPQMKVFLRLLTPDKTVKLTAVVASHPTHKPIPLLADHIGGILLALLRWPFALMLSTPRILYHAYILQWAKSLAMFPRPEPRMKGQEGVWNPPQNFEDDVGTRMDACDEGGTERWLRGAITRWAEERAKQTGIALQIVFRDARTDTQVRADGQSTNEFKAGISDEDSDTELVDLETDENLPHNLTITTSDPSFFTNLISAPTPRHYAVLAPELLTSICHLPLFLTFFSSDKDLSLRDRLNRSLTNLRRKVFRWNIFHSSIPAPPDLFIHADSHFTDSLPFKERMWMFWIVRMSFFGSWAEEAVMWKISAKYVDGGEPWKIWERALKRLYKEAGAMNEVGREGWEDLGSVRYT